MFGLVSFKTFIRDLSSSATEKAALTGLTIVGLCIPAAILMTLGHSERYVVIGVVLGIIPFQYLAYCVLQLRHRGSDPKPAKPGQTILSFRESSNKNFSSLNVLLQQQFSCLRGLEDLKRRNLELQLQWRRIGRLEPTLNVSKFDEGWSKIPITPIIVEQLGCSVHQYMVDLLNRNDERLSQLRESKDPIGHYPLSPNVGLMLSELTNSSALDEVIRTQRAPFELVD